MDVLFEDGPKRCGYTSHCYCWVKCHMWYISKSIERRTQSVEKIVKESKELIESSRLVREKSAEIRENMRQKYCFDNI